MSSRESIVRVYMIYMFIVVFALLILVKIVSIQFIKQTNLSVHSFLNGDFKNLFDNTKKLSKIVFDNCKPMIPNEFHDLWKKGIDSGSYFLKLCGSGGGGYILGFAPDIEQAKNDLKNYNLEVVYHF